MPLTPLSGSSADTMWRGRPRLEDSKTIIVSVNCGNIGFSLTSLTCIVTIAFVVDDRGLAPLSVASTLSTYWFVVSKSNALLTVIFPVA